MLNALTFIAVTALLVSLATGKYIPFVVGFTVAHLVARLLLRS